MKAISCLTAVAALLAPAASTAAPAPPRQPITPWRLDYGATACMAMRAYGDPAKPVTIAFRPSPNGKVVRLIVATSGGSADAEQVDVTAGFGANQVKATALHFGSSKSKSDLWWINVSRADLEPLRAAPELVLRGGGLDERFALPLISKVLDSLDTCNEDLRKYWNVDGGGTAPVGFAEPLKPLGSYFSENDYPSQAVRQGDTGRSVIMMMVDETGALKDCLVEQTSGIAVLDAMTCFVLQERAKFRPAKDAAGKPVRSVLTQSVQWRISG
jgi:hypothetical protein